ncbi:MAG: transcriptional regulator [Acidobacteria bacterium]|nr:MAG: transcriptional regulator [Acidobacteriota bacterium]
MPGSLPDLSRFELQCLRQIWARGEASVRDIHQDLEDPPSYSTVRKIVERLEAKGAVRRLRMEGKAWVYRPTVTPLSMIRKEIRRFLDSLFDGSAAPLLSHLTEMRALSLEDLREMERQIGSEASKQRNKGLEESDRKKRKGMRRRP